jgi:hypothetical protein
MGKCARIRGFHIYDVYEISLWASTHIPALSASMRQMGYHYGPLISLWSIDIAMGR